MNPDEILAFMSGFYGYGNRKAKLWFIGPEERGLGDEREIRLEQWLGNQEMFLDVHEYHQGMQNSCDDFPGLENKNFMRHLGPRAVHQTTWGKLCRVVLASRGHLEPTAQEVVTYQSTELGRTEGETLLTELWPLPNPSTNPVDWLWGDQACDLLPYLVTRNAYEVALAGDNPLPTVPHRFQELQALIAEHRPAAVVAYGIRGQYRDRLFGQDGWGPPVHVGQYSYANKMCEQTLVVSCVHPNAHGVSNAYFSAIGNAIAPHLNTPQ